ncbi:transmembrane protein 234-like isoform X2 [Rhopilema esculentum]
MKTGVKGLEKVRTNSLVSQVIAELLYLLKNWRYMAPFIINQGGSLLFYIAVSKNDISFAVPLVNSLTLVFTLITGYCLGEKLGKEVVFGIMMVMVGVTICISDKSG